MSLFSRACMPAIALAAISLTIAISTPAAAEDRHEGGRNRSGFNSNVTGGNTPRDLWGNNNSRRQHARNDRDGDRNGDRIRRWNGNRDFSGNITGGNTPRDLWGNNWRRNNHGPNWRWRDDRDWRIGRNDWGRDWNNNWRRDWNNGRDWDNVGNRIRPYYMGPYRPYYAGQYNDRERFNNNFYGGSISAYDDPGNGMYFYVDGYGDGGDGYPEPRTAPQGLKVISVTPETMNSGCSWEAGVCVIR